MLPQDKVARLRDLLSEATPRNAPVAQVHPPPSRRSARARNEREIIRILRDNGGNNPLNRAVQAACVPFLPTLTDDQVAHAAALMRAAVLQYRAKSERQQTG